MSKRNLNFGVRIRLRLYSVRAVGVSLHEKARNLPAAHDDFGPTCGLPAVPEAAGNFTCQRRHIYVRFRM